MLSTDLEDFSLKDWNPWDKEWFIFNGALGGGNQNGGYRFFSFHFGGVKIFFVASWGVQIFSISLWGGVQIFLALPSTLTYLASE